MQKEAQKHIVMIKMLFADVCRVWRFETLRRKYIWETFLVLKLKFWILKLYHLKVC